MQRKNVILTAGITAALIAGMVIAFVSIPVPMSLLMRKMFEFPKLSPPAGYATMKDSVTIHSDLVYPSKYAENTLDLYLPKEQSDSPLPVILWVHGGAYVGGDKRDARNYCTSLAAQGYAVISMNYARAPEARYPIPIIQMQEVYAWLCRFEKEYSFDLSRIVLAGDSAGAHSAATFALIQTNSDYAAKMGFKPVISAWHIRGLLLYCGPYDVPMMGDIPGFFGFMISRAGWAYFGTPHWTKDFAESATIRHHLTGDYPPVFITDANAASFKPQGQALVNALTRVNIPVKSYFPPDTEKTTHEYQFLMDTSSGAQCYAQTLAFLSEYVN